jgi:hypothetical protein
MTPTQASDQRLRMAHLPWWALHAAQQVVFDVLALEPDSEAARETFTRVALAIHDAIDFSRLCRALDDSRHLLPQGPLRHELANLCLLAGPNGLADPAYELTRRRPEGK